MELSLDIQSWANIGMNRWGLLDFRGGEKTGVYDYTLYQVSRGIEKMGGKAFLFPIDVERGGEEIARAVERYNLDIVMWVNSSGWVYWDWIRGVKVKKMNWWIDDPMRGMQAYGLEDVMKEAVEKGMVKLYVWDSGWGRVLTRNFGWNWDLLHLSADEKEFYEVSEHNGEEVVFIGNMMSMFDVAAVKEWMPYIFKNLARDCLAFIEEYKGWPYPSWHKVIETILSGYSEGDKEWMKQLVAENGGILRELRWMVWAHLKNKVRIEMLKRAAKVGRLMIFAEMKQLRHANEREIRWMTGLWDKDKVKIYETSDHPTNMLGSLYHRGRVHIEAVDPQSLEEGVPYRVFQTMASGRPLLTDGRPGWDSLFKRGEEIERYENMEDFEGKLASMLRDKSRCEEMGRKARERFEKEHTWQHRLEKIKRTML